MCAIFCFLSNNLRFPLSSLATDLPLYKFVMRLGLESDLYCVGYFRLVALSIFLSFVPKSLLQPRRMKNLQFLPEKMAKTKKNSKYFILIDKLTMFDDYPVFHLNLAIIWQKHAFGLQLRPSYTPKLAFTFTIKKESKNLQ